MTPSNHCRCPGCLPSIPPDPTTATSAEVFAHAEHLRKLTAIGALPDPDFHPYPEPPTQCPLPSLFPATCATPASLCSPLA
ncbi:MAG: hypothetical protein ACRYFZ_26405 [Janthinobacterium lividum]